jgi:transcriptional regulator with XRE-family HTH domain
MQVVLETGTILTCMSFGTVLKKVRKGRGVTQLQLAEKLGVTQATVARYEKGIMTPEVKRVSQMAKVLGVSVQELFEEKEVRPLPPASHTHGNSRQAKMQELFTTLPASDQKAILKNAEWLVEKRKRRPTQAR